MKKLTCLELGGACNLEISGETPEEMGDNCRRHAMDMVAQGDHAHIVAMEAMAAKSPAERQQFWTDFLERFEQTPEV